MISATVFANAAMINGLAIRYIPESSWPCAMAAFSAKPVMNMVKSTSGLNAPPSTIGVWNLAAFAAVRD